MGEASGRTGIGAGRLTLRTPPASNAGPDTLVRGPSTGGPAVRVERTLADSAPSSWGPLHLAVDEWQIRADFVVDFVCPDQDPDAPYFGPYAAKSSHTLMGKTSFCGNNPPRGARSSAAYVRLPALVDPRSLAP